MRDGRIKMMAEQYLRLGEDPPGTRLELVDGHIAVHPGQTVTHAHAVGALTVILAAFAEKHGLGEVLANLDVTLSKHDVRRPDVIFIRKGRRIVRRDRLVGVPDLAVEIVSETSGTIDRRDKFRQ